MSVAETDVSTSKRGIRVLALDGGGFRGLSSLILLRVLMEMITVKEHASATLRPSDYFDLIIGSGTGGLSALFVGRMQMTAQEAIDAYLRVGEQGFKQSSASLLHRLQGKEALFDGDALTRVIGDIVQEAVDDRDAQLQDPRGVNEKTLNFCRTAVLATYSVYATAPPYVFRSYRTGIDPASTHSINQAARATMAIAGAFPPMFIGSPPIAFIDAGGAGYNNPSEVALDEVARIWPGANITCLVSLGTGLQNIVRVGETSEDVTRVARRLAEDCEKVHDRLFKRSHRDRVAYYRFNVTTGLDGADFREWDRETSGNIAGITEGYAQKSEVVVSLNSCASILTGNVTADSTSQEDYEATTLSLLNIIKDDALAKEISTWLRAPDSSYHYHDACKKHQEGTGAWFIDGELFSNWKEDSASFICVYGKPGCGKTVLCSSLISHVDNMCQKENSSARAYFFFDGRSGQKEFQLLDGLIRSLIQQFVYQCDGIPSLLVELYEKPHQHPFTDTLGDLLLHILGGFSHTYIIIDSLDECTERRELLKWVKKVAVSKASNLHMLVTSRPEEEIKLVIQSFGPPSTSMDEDLVNHDIHVYMDSIIEEGRLERWSETVQSQIKGTLMQRAHGMFRWLAMQLEEVEQCLDEVELDEQLKRLPKDLDETYYRILARIPEQRRTRVKVFLQWTAFSARPLTLEELVEAGAMELDEENVPKYNPRRKFRPRDVLTACGSLVIELNGCVHLAHFSVKEYLVSDRLANGAVKYFSIRENLSHLFIAKTSLVYLLQLDSPGPLEDEILAAAPLAEYSARNWVFHVRAAGGDGVHDVYKHITTLMQSGSPFANWIRLWNPEYPLIHRELLATEIAEPLYYASLLGFKEVSRQLLLHGASTTGTTIGEHNAPEESSHALYGNPLQAACNKGHMETAKLLLEWGADANAEGGHYGSALQAAAHNGDKAIVKLLLGKGADINAGGGYYGNALHAAASNDHQAIVKLLLERGAEINAGGGYYGNALHAAASDGHQAIVKLLLEKGADVNAGGGYYGNALHAAASSGAAMIVKLLLEKGADVNAEGGYFGNALRVAASNGHEAIVKLLLEWGADANADGRHFGNALQAAACNGDEGIVKLLLEKGADVNAEGGHFGNALRAAASNGHQAIVKLLLEKGADVNTEGGHFGNALRAAASNGHGAIVKSLLENGADVNAEGGKFGNALQAAASNGHKAIVRLLLNKGADINAQGGPHGSALMAALMNGHLDIAKSLIARADLDLQAGEYVTPLQAAALTGDLAISKSLLELGAEVNTQVGLFSSPLQAASFRGHLDVVKLLLENNADVNAQGGPGGNALLMASFAVHEDVVKLLLENHADANAPGRDSIKIFLLYPFMSNIMAAAQVFREGGADDVGTQEKCTQALQAASRSGHFKIVKILIDHGAEVNAQGGIYGNALLAAWFGAHVEVVKLLLEHGATIPPSLLQKKH